MNVQMGRRYILSERKNAKLNGLVIQFEPTAANVMWNVFTKFYIDIKFV